MNNDLISRSELKKTLTRLHWTVEDGCWSRPYLDSIIDDIPTIEQPQGEWGETELLIDEDKCIEFRYVKVYYHIGCSNMGKYLKTTYSFCPYCGAKMKGGAE